MHPRRGKALTAWISWSLLICVLLGAGPLQARAQETRRIASKKLFEIRGTPDRPFRQPTDVAVDARGRIYVLDGLNGRVAVFDERGAYLRDLGTPGHGPGQLYMPVGLGLSPAGDVFVADSGNHRIQVFSPDGAFLRSFRLKNGERADPTDVLPLALKNRCYVVDNDNHQIQVYDTRTGGFIEEWGAHGKNLAEFRYPATIAADPGNNLYVVDVMNARVQTFNPFGGEAREIAGWGVKLGKLFRPKGVAVDREGRVYVSDSYMEIVQVFEKRGVFLGVLGDGQGHIRRFTTPTNVLIDPRGRLLVVETRANRVSVCEVLS